MRFRRLLINTRITDNVLISYAAGKKEVDGIVLGDPFCLKRSGTGIFDIPRLAREAKKRDLYVSYQTPVYLTSRNIDTVFSLIESLVRDSLVNEIKIQDPGILHRLGKIASSGINLTWSIYGYQREFPGMDIPINQGQIDFLRSKGVDSFEVTSAVAFSIMENELPLNFGGSKKPKKSRLQVQHYKYDLASFSGKCYTEAYSGRCCCNEGRESGDFPCDEPLYLEEDTEGGAHLPPMKYVVEGYRVLEFPDPVEFRALVKSGMNVEALVLMGNDIEEIEGMTGFLKDEPVEAGGILPRRRGGHGGEGKN